MMIRRDSRLEVRSLKRGRAGESAGGGGDAVDGPPAGGYALNLLRNAGGGKILFPPADCWRKFLEDPGCFGSGGGGVRVALPGGDTEKGFVEDFRPPLVEASRRGRMQVLPSRLSDCFVNSCKKETHKPKSSTKSRLDIGFASMELKERPICKKPKQEAVSNGNLLNVSKAIPVSFDLFATLDDRSGYPSRVRSVDKSPPLIGAGDSPRSVGSPTAERLCKGNYARKKDRLDEFVVGDILWARPGKSFPFWPAIVIDPMLQAPDAVLNSCIAGAACVMFFGYSGHGKKRVSICFKENYVGGRRSHQI